MPTPRGSLRSINPVACFFALGLGKGELAIEAGGVESVGSGKKESAYRLEGVGWPIFLCSNFPQEVSASRT